MKTLKLKPGKERSALRRHPWIFDSAIAKGGGDAGETVRVESRPKSAPEFGVSMRPSELMRPFLSAPLPMRSPLASVSTSKVTACA